jgi:hypothetical protein
VEPRKEEEEEIGFYFIVSIMRTNFTELGARVAQSV